MKTITTMTFGCDISDKKTDICCIDGAAEVVLRATIATTPSGYRAFFAARPSARVVLEVCTHSGWISSLLLELGHDPVVANPRNVKLISKGIDKCDRVDAELLARLGRADPKLLSPIRHREDAARQDLAVIRARAALVELRTAAVSHVRGVVKSFGGRIQKCTVEAFPKRARSAMPEALRVALDPVLTSIEALTTQIRALEGTLGTICRERHPDAQLLEQVDGVGPQLAMTYMLTLEDPRRFRRSRQVGAYVGLCPKRAQSGERDPQLRVSKTGDTYLRKLLVLSAHRILGPFGKDSDLRRWGLHIAERGGKNAKKRATVAVARRLAVLMHRLWLTGEEYKPIGYEEKAA